MMDDTSKMIPFLTPRQYFKLQEARPRKRFGQNFLEQPGTAERIVRSAALEASHAAVEIGPGLGALTRHIIPRVNRLHLIELDRDLAAYLEATLREASCVVEARGKSDSRSTDGVEAPGKAVEPYPMDSQFNHGPPQKATPYVCIHIQDVMDFDFTELGRTEGAPLVVLGNLPYNISSPLMFHLLESRGYISHGVFMVQKEVGERFAACPSTGEYGVLSVLLALYAKVTPLWVVGPGQFYPPPRVDSLVLRVDFLPDPQNADGSFPLVRQLVSTAFQKRRKTICNALKDFRSGDRELLAQALAAVPINPQRRPETLSPEEFLALARALG